MADVGTGSANSSLSALLTHFGVGCHQSGRRTSSSNGVFVPSGSVKHLLTSLLSHLLNTKQNGRPWTSHRTVESLDDDPPKRRRGPRGAAMPVAQRVALGAEAEMRRKAACGGRAWMRQFVYEHWSSQPGDRNYERCRSAVTRAIALHAKSLEQTVTGSVGRGRRGSGIRTKRVDPQRRLRAVAVNGTRPQKLPDLGEELFQWWVDMAETLRSRVPSSSLLAQASVIVEDARRYRELSAERGEPLSKCQLPCFSWDSRSATTWLCRWRKQFDLTPQTVNAKYKVSFAKRERRIGVAWRNACRLLVLHEEMFGPGLLVFMSLDEKPFYFNAIGAEKIWARRGSKKKMSGRSERICWKDGQVCRLATPNLYRLECFPDGPPCSKHKQASGFHCTRQMASRFSSHPTDHTGCHMWLIICIGR